MTRSIHAGAASAAATGLALASCHGNADVFAPAGPAARSLAGLGGAVLMGFSVVSAVMIVLFVVALTRRRGTLDAHAAIDGSGGERWIHVGGILIPAVVFGALLVVTLRELDRFPLHDGGHYRPDIRIVGRQWWWEVQYLGGPPSAHVTTANEIHVPLDWPVEIELESRDVIHSFWVPSLHGKVDLVPGHPNRIRIEADTPGRYAGECAEYCGGGHALMRYAVVAEPLADYERWLANEEAAAIEPADPEATVGRSLFETRACGVCHSVRGTPARGSVGPDLTHVAAREGIAAYSLPNTRAYLEAWITHAQSFKPGSQMPDLTEFDGREAQALTRYLEGLK
jgi:cytochrome c oxidase subunit 2